LSDEDLGVLAEEQAALRRVATLVARGAAPEEVFAAVTEEIGRLLPVDGAGMGRYEPDGTLTFVASWGSSQLRSRRQPVGRWGEEHRHARVPDRPPGPDRQLHRCLRPGRGQRPRERCPLVGRDADHR
jgi:GAF domain-containing protein